MLNKQKFESSMGIYMIRNTINGHSYIGRTNNLYKRKRDHRYNIIYKSKNNFSLYRAMRKHGLENFEFIVLEYVEDKNLLSKKEVFYINKYQTYKDGYNMTEGGEIPFDRTGIPSRPKVTEEDVKRIRAMYAGPALSLDDAYEQSGVKDILSKRGFQAIWNGQSWKNVDYDSYLENKDRQTSFSSSRTGNHAKKITDEEVRDIRKKKKEKYDCKSVWMEYQEKVTYSYFRKIWNGSVRTSAGGL